MPARAEAFLTKILAIQRHPRAMPSCLTKTSPRSASSTKSQACGGSAPSLCVSVDVFVCVKIGFLHLMVLSSLRREYNEIFPMIIQYLSEVGSHLLLLLLPVFFHRPLFSPLGKFWRPPDPICAFCHYVYTLRISGSDKQLQVQKKK